jgi:hypothetical protein
LCYLESLNFFSTTTYIYLQYTDFDWLRFKKDQRYCLEPHHDWKYWS